MKTIKNATNFDELLDIKYGKPGTEKRDEFEMKAKAFIVGEMIKEERKKAHLTQEDWPYFWKSTEKTVKTYHLK